MRPRPRYAPDPEMSATAVGRQALRGAGLALAAGRLDDAASYVRTACAVARLVRNHPALDPEGTFAKPETLFKPGRDVFVFLKDLGWTPPPERGSGQEVGAGVQDGVGVQPVVAVEVGHVP